MDTDLPSSSKPNDTNEPTDSDNHQRSKQHDEANVTYWLTSVNSEGSLCIYNLFGDNVSQMYSLAKFNMAPKTLMLRSHLNGEMNQTSVIMPARSSLMDTTQPQVYEILMIGSGYDKKRPFLAAKIDEDLVVYEGFIATVTNVQSGGMFSTNNQLNFKRVNHDAIIRDRKKRKSQGMNCLFPYYAITLST